MWKNFYFLVPTFLLLMNGCGSKQDATEKNFENVISKLVNNQNNYCISLNKHYPYELWDLKLVNQLSEAEIKDAVQKVNFETLSKSVLISQIEGSLSSVESDFRNGVTSKEIEIDIENINGKLSDKKAKVTRFKYPIKTN